MGSDGLVSLPHSPAAPQAPKAPGDLRRRRCPLNFKKPGSLETMARIQNAKKIWLQRAHFLARNPFNTKILHLCRVTGGRLCRRASGGLRGRGAERSDTLLDNKKAN